MKLYVEFNLNIYYPDMDKAVFVTFFQRVMIDFLVKVRHFVSFKNVKFGYISQILINITIIITI